MDMKGSLGRKVAIIDSLGKDKKKGKAKGKTEHKNIEPIKPQPLKGLHAGAKAVPPKKDKKKESKSKPKKANVPNAY